MNTVTGSPGSAITSRWWRRPWFAALAAQAALHGLAGYLIVRDRADLRPVVVPLSAPALEVSGISFDGRSLWMTIDGGNAIYQVDPVSNAVGRRMPFFENATGGSAWDGRHLWQLAWLSKRIHRLDLRTGAVLETIPTPGKGMCSGMTYDGAYLWVANFEDRKIYQIDQGHGGAILRTVDGLKEVTGLAWDGSQMWNGILPGVENHDDPTPNAGFVQRIDLASGDSLEAIPLSGVGPGTSDWLPGQRTSRRFWWYDGHHRRIVRIELPSRTGIPIGAVVAWLAGTVIAFAFLVRYRGGGFGDQISIGLPSGSRM